MMAVEIHIPLELWIGLRSHLFQSTARDRNPEEAAFGYAAVTAAQHTTNFSVSEMHLVAPQEFELQSEYHFTLTDEALGYQIKQAWDRGLSLVEFHCHRWPDDPPQFSLSDISGFSEIVPHLFWRLKGRPYGAVLLTPRGVDAVAWIKDGEQAEAVDRIVAGHGVIKPSGLTIATLRARYGTL